MVPTYVIYLKHLMYYFHYRQFIQIMVTELKSTMGIFSCCGSLDFKIEWIEETEFQNFYQVLLHHNDHGTMKVYDFFLTCKNF